MSITSVLLYILGIIPHIVDLLESLIVKTSPHNLQVFILTGSRIPHFYIHSHKHHAGTISFELCTSLSYIFAAVTYSAVWSLVSSPVQTSLPPISSEPLLCESSRGTEERLHHTRLVQPSLLHAHGDTPVVSWREKE